MTRQTKTPKQRAEEALAVADRRVGKLTKQAAQRRTELEAIDRELAAERARRDHLKTHPDLQPTTPTGATP
jgi:cell division protein FtsB